MHRQVLGLQDLDLQGNAQTVFGPAITQPNQGFTAFEHRPTGHGLQAIEVRQPGCIGFNRPVAPQGLHGFALQGIGEHGLGLDAGANGIGHIGFQSGVGPGITAHQVPALGAQFILVKQHGGNSTGIADRPGQRTPATTDTVIGGRGLPRGGQKFLPDGVQPAH